MGDIEVLTPKRAIQSRLMQYAAGLRYPRLLALTVTLFIVDLIFPDVIPFVDEILLGLISLLLAALRRRKTDTVIEQPKAGR